MNVPIDVRRWATTVLVAGLAAFALLLVASPAGARQHGWRKPAREIFDAAVSRLGVAANQTWFIGDTVDEDIAGARAA